MQGCRVRLFGRGQLDQLIGISVGEAVSRTHPAALHAAGRHRAAGIELHPHTPGRTVAAGPQAEGPGAELERKHRQGAPRQVEAGAPAPGFQVEGGADRHQAAGIGHVDPEALAASRQALEGEAIVDVLGVVVIDREAVLAAEIEPLIIPGPGGFVVGQQPLRLGLEVGAEAQVPAAAAQGGKVVGLPATEIHQQVADRPGFGLAMRRLQGLAQNRRQGLATVSTSPLLQELQLQPLLLPQQVGVERLPGPQDLLPGPLLALLALLAVAGLAQLEQVVAGPGADPLLAQAEPELVAVKPQPGRRQLGWGVAAGHEVAPGGQVEAFARNVLEQQPGGGALPGRRQGRRELRRAEGPRKNSQPSWWIDTGRQGADQLNVTLRCKLGARHWPDHQLQPAGLNGLHHGQAGLAVAAPVGRQTD